MKINKELCMKKLMIFIILGGLLSGCSQTQMSDFTNSISNTLGGIVSVDSGDESSTSSSTTKQSQKSSGNFTLNLPQNVDTVFSAMVSEFEFQSPEYIRQIRSADAEIIMADGYYHYERNPGAFYYLGNGYLKHKGVILALEMKIVKSGTGTKITAEYLYGATSASVKDEIIARIKNAVK